MSNGKTSRFGSIAAFVLSGITIAAATLIFFNRQYVLDQLTVWSFTPSSNVVQLADTTAFTDKGRFAFYATKPVVATQAEFNSSCPRQEVGSPILGCYTSEDRIYIYDLTNQQLNGMEEVTAAHETLHAVWSRLSESERKSLGAQLRAAYTSLNDKELNDRMAYYERTEPGEFENELHSIIGTEIANLPAGLEAYYNQYFDRQKVLALHTQYDTVYKQLYGRADALYSQMETLSKGIESRSASYNTASDQLTADINSFNTRANSGGFSSMSEFNSQRVALVSRSNQLESQRSGINADINNYNGLYEEYQTIASQIEVLNKSIDSFSEIQSAPSV